MRVSSTVRSCFSPSNPGTRIVVSGSANTTPTRLMTPVSAVSRPAMAPARRPGLLVAALGPQAGVDRDERRRQHALAQQVLHQVGDAQRRLEGVGGRARAEEGADDHLADEPGAPGQQDAGRHQERPRGELDGGSGPSGGRAVRRLGGAVGWVAPAAGLGQVGLADRRRRRRARPRGAWSARTARAAGRRRPGGVDARCRRRVVGAAGGGSDGAGWGQPVGGHRPPAARRAGSPGARRSSTAPAAGWRRRATRAPARTCRPGPAARRSGRRARYRPCSASSAARAQRRPGRSATALSLRPRNSRARRRLASP